MNTKDNDYFYNVTMLPPTPLQIQLYGMAMKRKKKPPGAASTQAPGGKK